MTSNDGNSSVLNHLAIIMDGNGRWAKERGHHRVFGHVRGAKIAKRTIEECSKLGIKYLTLYTFSTENWKRPQEEISVLMKILTKYLSKERKNCVKNNIKFSYKGDISKLPQAVINEVNQTVIETSENTGMVLTFAINYGGRQEILSAVAKLVADTNINQFHKKSIDESLFSKYINPENTPDPDLIIRTSGEFRLSNFLTWQSVYSELQVIDTYWPNFTMTDLKNSIYKFLKVERRFGKTSEQIKNNEISL